VSFTRVFTARVCAFQTVSGKFAISSSGRSGFCPVLASV
jgi:hypothetical protein